MSNSNLEHKTATYRCPSNIALVKYWGKKEGGVQLPANPSISWTLNDLYAETTVIASPKKGENPNIEFYLDGKPKPSFEPKIHTFLQRISLIVPAASQWDLRIESSNNFPHGAGIASSAAGFGALALCIVDLEGILETGTPEFYQKVSVCARLGSGSACRSMFEGAGVWGEISSIPGSSDEYAVAFPFSVSEKLTHWKDAVLIVDDGEKTVSSTQGHDLLKSHAYAQARFGQAHKNLTELSQVMQEGNVSRFIELVESEALQLHAMMMSSIPYYMLIRPNTLAIIELIWKKRKETNWEMAFTLDAGANVHLLYNSKQEADVMNFINAELLPYCKNQLYLCSAMGGGPTKIN
jgi:diphosphomevalonate decarboxylase